MQNIQSRLYLLVLITTLPFFIYTGFIHYQKIQDQKNDILAHLTEIASLTAAENKQINEGARQLLIAISTNASVRTKNPLVCNKFLSTLKQNYVRYVNFGVVDKSGHLICAADLPQATLNPLSPSLINQTLTSGEFSVGAYYPIEPTGSVINFTYPLDRQTLVYASISLDWVSDFIGSLHTANDNLVINILDKNGTVLARSPKTESAIGQNFATDPLVKEIIAVGSGKTTKVGIDQISRLYAFTSLNDTHSTFIAVGIPEFQIFTSVRQSLVSSILIILSISAVSLLLASRIGKHLIVKQIESLQAIDKLKNEFVSLASHQIRSPLTAIRWLSESLLDSRGSLPANQADTLTKIHATTLRLISLTSTLLNISRLESGTLSPHYQIITLSEVVQVVVHELAPQSSKSKVLVRSRLTKKRQVTTDPILLAEIIRVLLGNAIKYASPKTVIKINESVGTQHFTLSIANEGIGIPVSANGHIFTRFYRADNARLHHPDGNGLGLYLASLIAGKLGGTITFSSSKKLTIFSVALPNKVE